MIIFSDISTALHLLEHVQERVEDCNDPKLQMHTTQDIKSLISLLEDPVFRSIVTIQDSLIELNSQLGQHPSIIPGDFDINISGQLELSVPSTPVQPLGSNVYQDLYQDSSELEDQRVPVVPLVHSSSEDTSAQVKFYLVCVLNALPTSFFVFSTKLSFCYRLQVQVLYPRLSECLQLQQQRMLRNSRKLLKLQLEDVKYSPCRLIEYISCDVYLIFRDIKCYHFFFKLYKPEGTSLGFSVVGLRSKDKGELGIFLQEIQPKGIAGW